METRSKGKSPATFATPQIPFVEEVVEEVQAAEEEPECSVKPESPSHQTGREPKKLKTFIFQCMLYF